MLRTTRACAGGIDPIPYRTLTLSHRLTPCSSGGLRDLAPLLAPALLRVARAVRRPHRGVRKVPRVERLGTDVAPERVAVERELGLPEPVRGVLARGDREHLVELLERRALGLGHEEEDGDCAEPVSRC
jgi:hypothetical protein